MILISIIILFFFLFIKLILFFCKKKDYGKKILIDNLYETNEDIEDDIDAIITWVDSSDKYWQNQRNYYFLKENCISTNNDLRFPNPEFSDLELYFCVSTINKYLPWIRNIFIITCFNQKPSWIDKFSKVKIIDHKDIIPNEYLPTFNSIVIESFMHKIKNLSEKFIYFNDDCYVNRYLKKNFFFEKNYPIITGKIRNIPLHYSSLSFIYLFFIKLFQSKHSLINKSANVKYMSLLNKDTIIYPSHVAMPLTRKIMYYLENNYKNEFIITGRAKFRSCTDLRITYLAANYTKYVSIHGKDKKFMGILNFKNVKNQYLICFNSVYNKDSFFKLKKFFKDNNNIIY